MLEIHRAEETEFEKIEDFYNTLIDGMAQMEYEPGWKKGIYPSGEYLYEAILNRELYAATKDGIYAAAMILNHRGNEGYHRIRWQTEAEEREIMVIHTLGVLPSFHGKGISGAMVNKAIAIAADNRQKVIRLDVLRGNLPAERLYKKAGFQYAGTIQMFYEDTGMTDYDLYEYQVAIF